jgi:Ice-binding-like
MFKSAVRSLDIYIRMAFYISAKNLLLRTLAMNHRQKHLSACLLAMAALFSMVPIQGAWAQVAPDLGAASGFAALGGTGVTCTSPDPAFTGITVSGGNVGSGSVAPTTVTGFPGFTPGANPCSLDPGRTPLLGQTAAIGALITAYGTIDTANPCPTDDAHNLVGDLGGKTLLPGIYCISGAGGGDAPALLTSPLMLNANGNSNAVWIFKGVSITPINGSVVMAGGGQACNVYWRLGTTAVFDGNTDFVGNVLAGTAISFTGVGSSLNGRALAQSLVSMTGANVSACTGGGTQPPSCDKDCKHDKHHKHHKPHCDGEHDGHDKDGHGNHENDNDGNDNDDQGQDDHPWK